VLVAGGGNRVAILPKPPVHFIHLILALLAKPDVEIRGISHLGLVADLHAGERQDHPIIVRQESNVVVTPETLHFEILL
jgi:hypothetical protein